MLNRKYELRLGLKEALYAYTIKRYNLGRYYLVADAKLLHLVTNLPTTSNHKPWGNVFLFGAWGCARDPMLREFSVNTYPNVDMAQGSQPYSVSSLATWLNGMNLP